MLHADSEQFVFPDGLGGLTLDYGLWLQIGERLGLPYRLTEYEQGTVEPSHLESVAQELEAFAREADLFDGDDSILLEAAEFLRRSATRGEPVTIIV